MGEIKPPKLESLIGMNTYRSKTPGIGGVIKQLPEDFIVEEITPEGRVLELDKDLGFEAGERKEYLHFTLQKYNWDTLRAVKVLSNRLHTSRKRFGFAGTKDKRALTAQRVSVWDTTVEQMREINLKDVTLKDYCYCDERINLGGLQGNRFTIVIRRLGLGEKEVEDRIRSITEELNQRIPNYFGVQRFGTVRPITHRVGEMILRRNFKKAVMVYLSEVYEGESPESSKARDFLAKTDDFKEALKVFPKHLGYENSMLNHLARTPTDYIGALRRLPKKLRWMFIHAYQAYIFNLALSEYIREGTEVESLPLPGYGIVLDQTTADILKGKNISQEDFNIKEMPELSSEGLLRESFMEVRDLEILYAGDDELNDGLKKAAIRLSLSKGSYATSVLREIMKNEYWKTR
ncbi:MAG: tRNA pseudouridine(13) synthase TruD [Candidatus Altiarchaeota archaeon]|nr:tRNA pseudouridine(13) synthase TruD [Candidatus Altiarchaeota archaeon]